MIVFDFNDRNNSLSGLYKEPIRLSVINNLGPVQDRIAKPWSWDVFISEDVCEVLLDLRFILESDSLPTFPSTLFDEGWDSVHDFDSCDIINPL